MQENLSSALNRVIDMARTHVEDIESGIQDGTYSKEENVDIGEKKLAIDIVQSFYTAEFCAAEALRMSQQSEAGSATQPRYFIGKLMERNGEQEYCHTVRFMAVDPVRYLDDVASRFHDENGGDDSEHGYLFHGGSLCVRAWNHQQIDKAMYVSLAGIISGV